MTDEMETNYLAAAISALNKIVTSDVSPRLASKIVRFRKILTDYAAKGNGSVTEFDENGVKDANGNEIADV